MATVTIRFEVIKHQTQVSGTCTVCGKKRTRRVKVESTVNPFNKGPDGFPKTWEEVDLDVWNELTKEADALKANFVCATCAGLR
jgi:hypothetical protein